MQFGNLKYNSNFSVSFTFKISQYIEDTKSIPEQLGSFFIFLQIGKGAPSPLFFPKLEEIADPFV